MNVSATSLILAGVTLSAALAIYWLYVLAQVAFRRGTVLRQDYVMLPGLTVVITAIGLGLEWTDRHRPALLGGVGFAAFLGLNLGRVIWRTRR